MRVCKTNVGLKMNIVTVEVTRSVCFEVARSQQGQNGSENENAGKITTAFSLMKLRMTGKSGCEVDSKIQSQSEDGKRVFSEDENLVEICSNLQTKNAKKSYSNNSDNQASDVRKRSVENDCKIQSENDGKNASRTGCKNLADSEDQNLSQNFTKSIVQCHCQRIVSCSQILHS